MATTPQQGIMALPETDQANAPQLSLHESYDAAKQGLNAADPQFSSMYDAEMAKAMPELLALSDEQLDSLLQLVQYLQDHPEEYKERVAELENDGILEKGDFPAEYDENFLSVFGAAVIEAQKHNQPAPQQAMQPPMQLAKGGIAEAARMVASHGRSGDTMLAHITKDEADLLRRHGGLGTLNPRTGLREYGFWSSVKSAVSSVAGGLGITKAIKAVGGVVKSVLASPLGRIVATVALAAFLGPAGVGLASSTWAAAGLASAGITALGGGNLKDVVKAGVTGAIAGYGAQVLGPAMGSATGVTNAAGQAAMGAGVTGAGVGALQGKSVKESVVDGLTAAAISGAYVGASQGFNAQVDPATGKVVGGKTSAPDSSKVPGSEQVLTPDQAGKVDAQTGQVAGQSGVPDWLKPEAGTTQAPASEWGGAKAWAAEGQNMNVPTNQQLASQNMSIPGQPGATPPAPEPTFMDSAKQWYNENLSPSGREQAGIANAKAEALKGYNEDLAAGVPKEIAVQNYQTALKAASPGILSTYGPAVATGLGITALAGGFGQKQPEVSQADKDIYTGKATQDIISANPKNYITQNLPGVTYDAAGNITGSAPWTPRSGSGTTEVAGNYIPYSPTYTPPPTYSTPVNAIGGGRQIAQPYNTAAMYDFRPRYAAQGGMMESQGAFPNNPLTMPSSPLMAMDSQRLPMNTPGVPMNMPMGFAQGGMPPMGIASLAPGGYPRRTGQISGPGTETSDDIPAMLSDGEFVMTAKAVKGMGAGSRRAGAKKMYALMHHLEKNAARG